MKVLDLRNHARCNGAWWVDYLAWLASTPRNWIERKLEPLINHPDARLQIIDVTTPEEEGIVAGYPTADVSVWWTIMCLDGAPERMKYQIEDIRQPHNVAHTMLAPNEIRFRCLVTAELDHRPVKPAVRVLGDWRDGIIVGYETRESATAAVIHTACACTAVNRAELLPWTEQFHVRAGIGLSLREAFSGLLHARRDELSCVAREPGTSFPGTSRERIALASFSA